MARRKRQPEHANSDRWLVSYADFITLLFAFFVVMFAISQVDSAKLGRFVQSLQVALELSGPFPSQGPDPVGTKDAAVSAAPSLSAFSVQLSPMKGPKSSTEDARTELAAVKSALNRYLSRPEIRRKVRTIRDRRGVTISLSETGLFGPGSDVLLSEALPGLNRLAGLLRELNVQVLVEGHTDDVSIVTPRFPTNWDLAAARAVAVIRHLTEECGIAAYRFAAVSYGSSRPFAPNDTAEGRAMNRRVDVVLVGIDPIVLREDLDAPPEPAGGDGAAAGQQPAAP